MRTRAATPAVPHSSKVYTVLAQQGAWIRVAMTKTGSTETDDTEMWIYAPNGTLWSKAR